MFEGRKVLWVAGGRDYIDYKTIHYNLDRQLYRLFDVLIAGAARGADSVAQEIWRNKMQAPYVGIPAEWNRLGKRAGYVRNETIAQQEPDKLLVFPGGKGTQHAIDLAEEYNIEIEYAEEVR